MTEKIILILITIAFLVVAIFFREETGIRTSLIVLISLVLVGGYLKLFLKSDK